MRRCGCSCLQGPDGRATQVSQTVTDGTRTVDVVTSVEPIQDSLSALASLEPRHGPLVLTEDRAMILVDHWPVEFRVLRVREDLRAADAEVAGRWIELRVKGMTPGAVYLEHVKS